MHLAILLPMYVFLLYYFLLQIPSCNFRDRMFMFLYIFKRIISFNDDMLPNFGRQKSNSKYFNEKCKLFIFILVIIIWNGYLLWIYYSSGMTLKNIFTRFISATMIRHLIVFCKYIVYILMTIKTEIQMLQSKSLDMVWIEYIDNTSDSISADIHMDYADPNSNW